MALIEDGQGSGRKAGVNIDYRLAVAAIMNPLVDFITSEGNTYEVDSGSKILTTATESGILYLTNTNQSLFIFLDRIRIGMGKSTGGTPNAVTVKIYRNPSTGTLISGGIAITPSNRDFAVAGTPLLTALSGVEGSTITNGTVLKTMLFRDLYDEEFALGLIIPSGNSIAISITPPTGNTSMAVAISFTAMFVDEADFGSGGQ